MRSFDSSVQRLRSGGRLSDEQLDLGSRSFVGRLGSCPGYVQLLLLHLSFGKVCEQVPADVGQLPTSGQSVQLPTEVGPPNRNT